MVVWRFLYGDEKVVYSVAVILLRQSAALPRRPEPRTSLKAGTIKLDHSLRLTFAHDYIAGDHGADLCFTQADMGLVCRPLVDWLELGINYRRSYERTDADPYKAVNRPHMNVALHGQILAFDVSSRLAF